MTAITLRNIHKRYGAHEVIKGIDLEIRHGEFMVFVGPSGCGKSTMLRLIAGLEDISAGEMTFDGTRVNEMAPHRRGIAMVFQSYALYPHMTVRQNMAFGLKLARTDTSTVTERVDEAAAILQIGHLLERLPRQLSGGQRQRVAIGRAIVRKPRVFLFDEPLSNLDASLRVQTRIEIAKLHAGMSGVTMIYVTHDQVEAMTMADRICVLRDGVVEQVGTPMELYTDPNSVFVGGFIGSPRMNFLPGAMAPEFDAPTIGVRPEDLRVVEDGPRWAGALSHVEELGGDHLLYIDIAAPEPLVVKRDGPCRTPVGRRIGVGIDPARVYRFDANERRIAAA